MDETELARHRMSVMPGTRGRIDHGSWRFLLAVPFVLVVRWSIDGTGFDVGQLVAGSRNTYLPKFAALLLHPNLERGFLGDCLGAVLQTLQISILGIVFGALLAFPLAIFSTRGLLASGGERTGWRGGGVGYLCYMGARSVLSFWRAMPPLLWVLLFIIVVGLGPFPAVLALSLHSAGLLGKLYAEVMEAVDKRPIEALRATGAGWLQVLCYAVVPQAWAGFISLTLYQWECNVRDSVVVGVVGAGGVGTLLYQNLQLFNYHDVSTLIIITFALVVVVDNLSALLHRTLTA